jgi:hypothetical protein
MVDISKTEVNRQNIKVLQIIIYFLIPLCMLEMNRALCSVSRETPIITFNQYQYPTCFGSAGPLFFHHSELLGNDPFWPKHVED